MKTINGLVGSNTYILDLSRATKNVERYKLYGDFVTVGMGENRQKIFRVNHEKIIELTKFSDNLVENNNDEKS